jgi:hypothetical protein
MMEPPSGTGVVGGGLSIQEHLSGRILGELQYWQQKGAASRFAAIAWQFGLLFTYLIICKTLDK